jgi:hypothetical protein
MQPAASANGAVPEAVARPASGLERVRYEWRERIGAEYTSAAITQHVTLWLIQAGAPPDVIESGLAIVADELAHSRLSHDVYVAAGGSAPPALDQAALGLARSAEPLANDIARAIVRVFCLGETVAVPLFRHLREQCIQPIARAALDRILRDEVRHRDFGWDALDWLCAADPSTAARVAPQLPGMLAELEQSYGLGNPVVAQDRSDLTADERAWGLAPPREYAAILATTIEKDYMPRFAARGISMEAHVPSEVRPAGRRSTPSM